MHNQTIFLKPGSKNQNCVICFPLFADTGTDSTETPNHSLTNADMDEAHYIREGEQADVNGSVQGGTIGLHEDWGFIELDASNETGMYQFGIPDAAIDHGAKWVDFLIGFAAAQYTDILHLHIDLQVLNR